MDQQSTSLAPDFVAAAHGVVAVATWDSFTVWQYDTTRKAATIIGALALDQARIDAASGAASQRVSTREANNGKVFYIDQPLDAGGPMSQASLTGKTTDLICAITCNPSLLLVVSEQWCGGVVKLSVVY